MLEAFVLDGTVTLAALAVLGLELAIVLGLAIARGKRPFLHLVANALSGVFLILALRAALLGLGGGAIALCLGLAFVAHVGDVAARLRN